MHDSAVKVHWCFGICDSSYCWSSSCTRCSFPLLDFLCSVFSKAMRYPPNAFRTNNGEDAVIEDVDVGEVVESDESDDE